MKKYKATCDKCKIKMEADTEGELRRKVGYHNYVYHQIPGVTSTAEKRRIQAREWYWKKQGHSPEKIAALRARYEARHSPAQTADEPVKTQKPKVGAAEPMALTYCPYCDRRFYSTKGQ